MSPNLRPIVFGLKVRTRGSGPSICVPTFSLLTTSGQNLKRLLRKRGWGRHPFPAEAVALMPPPGSQPSEILGYDLLKSYRPSIAVASFVACGAFQTFVETQTSSFSLVTIHLMHFSRRAEFLVSVSIDVLASIRFSVSFSEMLRAVTFVCSTRTF